MESAVTQNTIGVIGLGTMGRPMAGQLLKHQNSLVVNTRTPRVGDPLVAAGATWVDTPREVAESCCAVLVMLPDLPQLRDVLEGPDGLVAGAQDKLLLMIGSTSSPSGVRDLADELKNRTEGRIAVVDTPVSGGEDGAAAGTLSIMIGGPSDDASRAAQILTACGTPIHLGPIGAGQVAKACNQMVVASTIMALGESCVLAERSGLDVERLLDLFGRGYAGGNLLTSRKDKLAHADYSPSGVARNMLKDLDFAADVADSTGTYPALLPTLKRAFEELVESGYGDKDIAVARQFVEKRR